MLTFLYYRLNMCVKLFLVVLKSRQVNLSVMLLLNLFVNLFVFVNSLVYLCLLKASVALLIVSQKGMTLILLIINTRRSVSVCVVFSFTQSTKAILVCNIFTIRAYLYIFIYINIIAIFSIFSIFISLC